MFIVSNFKQVRKKIILCFFKLQSSFLLYIFVSGCANTQDNSYYAHVFKLSGYFYYQNPLEILM